MLNLEERLLKMSEMELLMAFLEVVVRPGELTVMDISEIRAIDHAMVVKQMAARA